MTKLELSKFLEKNKHIEWFDQEAKEQIYFRNTQLSWYRSNPNRATIVKYYKLHKMSFSDLIKEINRGLEVEGITRITGYFTKVASWNPGKRGELKDRQKFTV